MSYLNSTLTNMDLHNFPLKKLKYTWRREKSVSEAGGTASKYASTALLTALVFSRSEAGASYETSQRVISI